MTTPKNELEAILRMLREGETSLLPAAPPAPPKLVVNHQPSEALAMFEKVYKS